MLAQWARYLLKVKCSHTSLWQSVLFFSKIYTLPTWPLWLRGQLTHPCVQCHCTFEPGTFKSKIYILLLLWLRGQLTHPVSSVIVRLTHILSSCPPASLVSNSFWNIAWETNILMLYLQRRFLLFCLGLNIAAPFLHPNDKRGHKLYLWPRYRMGGPHFGRGLGPSTGVDWAPPCWKNIHHHSHSEGGITKIFESIHFNFQPSSPGAAQYHNFRTSEKVFVKWYKISERKFWQWRRGTTSWGFTPVLTTLAVLQHILPF